jgi:hypothetical protein
MVQVLRAAPYRMLRAEDLAAEINAQRLYRMRDGRMLIGRAVTGLDVR